MDCQLRWSRNELEKRAGKSDIIEILIPSRDKWNGANLPLISLSIYTDGSDMEEGVREGVFIEQIGMAVTYMMDGKCCVFQAEIFAIIKAAETIENKLTG